MKEQGLLQQTGLTFMSNGYDKIRSGDTVPVSASNSAKLYAAKNDTECCQISIRPAEKLTGLKFEYADISGDISVEILREAPIAMTGGYPDPVYPIKNSFTLSAEETTSFIIKVKVGAAAAAGDYSTEIRLTGKDGTLYGLYDISLHVWDFALPEETRCATAVGLYKASIAKIHGCSDEEAAELYVQYYEKLLEYKVCAYDLPYDILDERADKYMSDPRVTAFKIPYVKDDDKLMEYYRKLSSNPVWFAKGYFYPLDEPTNRDMLNDLAVIAERLSRLWPDYRLCTPFFTDVEYSDEQDQVEFMTGKTNLWCPKTFLYNGSALYGNNGRLKAKYDIYSERMKERQKLGDTVWWYVCWEPGDPYCNLFVDQKGLQHRLLYWQQRYNDVTGFLYWGANYWSGTENPWTDIATVKELSPEVYGDGSLLYNGSFAAVKGACGSMRLEAIRDGIEDYDLLTLAAEKLGRDYVYSLIGEISPSLVKYTASSEEFDAMRIRIGSELEAAMK